MSGPLAPVVDGRSVQRRGESPLIPEEPLKLGSQPSTHRLAAGTGVYLVEAVGAVILISGSLSGLYIAAVALVLNVAFLISAAWLLVVSVYGAKSRS